MYCPLAQVLRTGSFQLPSRCAERFLEERVGPFFQEECTMAQPVSRPTISAEQFSRLCDEIRSAAAPEVGAQSIRDCALRIVQALGLALSTDDLSGLLAGLMVPGVAPPPGSPRYTREPILDRPDERPGDDEGPVR